MLLHKVAKSRFVLVVLLASTWAFLQGGVYLSAIAVGDTDPVPQTGIHPQDGVFLPNPRAGVRATMEGGEVVVRFPVVKTTAPRAKGILLVDSDSNSRLKYTPKCIVLMEAESNTKSACLIQVILNQPLAEQDARVPVLGEVEEPSRVVVLGDVVFWSVRVNHFPKSPGIGWLSLPVESGQKAAQCLRDAARVFDVAEKNVLDLRMSEEERAKPAVVHGPLTERDVAEIRRTVFAFAQREILDDLVRLTPEAWPELLGNRKLPGRHALNISLSDNGRQAAVYYAPNAGCQFEKVDGKWMIVGG